MQNCYHKEMDHYAHDRLPCQRRLAIRARREWLHRGLLQAVAFVSRISPA